METSMGIIDYHERAYGRAKVKNHEYRKQSTLNLRISL
jgi:hypothetical protein